MALVEVCIAAHDSQSGNTLEGDILCIRKPSGGIGKKEGKDFLWLLMDEADLPEGSILKSDPQRLGIDLEELAASRPDLELDLAKCRCPNTWYQPFFDTCPKTCKHRDLRERPCKVNAVSRLARAARRMEREKQEQGNGEQPNKRG